MDLAAVKEAPALELGRASAAAVRNALGLADDAALLSEASRLATMSEAEVADILGGARAFAVDIDRLKQRGRYVDMDRRGEIREPSQVTATQVRAQLDLARQAAAGADGLLDEGTTASATWLTAPAAIALDFSSALVSAFGEAGHARTAEAAADVLLNAASRLRGWGASAAESPESGL